MRWKVIALTLALLGVQQWVRADDVYVSNTGADGNPGTLASPKRTLSSALALVPAADFTSTWTIWMGIPGDAVYTNFEKLVVSGKGATAAFRLNFKPTAGVTATLEPPTSGAASTRNNVIKISDDYVTIDGDPTSAGTRRIIFQNTQNNSLATDAGVLVRDDIDTTPDGNEVLNSEFTNNYNCGIAFWTSAYAEAVGGVLIQGCNVHDNNGAYGIFLSSPVNAGTGVYVRDNIVSGHTGTAPRGTTGIYINVESSAANLTIERNIIFKNEYDLRLNDTGGCTVKNNTIYHTITTDPEAGLVLDGDGGTSTNNVVTNNVIWAVGSGAANSAKCVWLINDSAGTYNYNDLYATGSAAIGGTGLTGNNASTHYDFAGWQGTGRETNSINFDPAFLSVAAGTEDFHVRSSFGRWTGRGTDSILGTSDDTFAYDTLDSPTIDAADPVDTYPLEPLHNGSRRDQGAYGNTAQSSKSGFYDGTTSYKTWTGKSVFGTEWGPSNANWSNPDNWAPRAVPTSSEVVYVPDRGVATNASFWEPSVDVGTAAALRVRLDNTTLAASGTRDQLRYPSGAGAPTLGVSAGAGNLTLGAASGDAMTILPGATLTMSNGAITLSNGVNIANSGTISMSGGTLTGPAASTLTVSSATGALTITGGSTAAVGTDFVVNTNGTLNTTAAATIGFQRNITFTAPYTTSYAANTVLALSGANDQSISVNGATLPAVDCNKSAGTASMTTNFTVSGTLTVTAGTFRIATSGVVGTLQSTASVLAAGTLLLEGSTTLKFNQSPPSVVDPQLAVDGILQTTGTTGSFPLMTRDVDASRALTISITGTSDLNGATVRRLGTVAGVEGLQVALGATLVNLNDLVIEDSDFGVNFLKTTGVYAMRGCSFDSSVAYNVKVPVGVPPASDLRIDLENSSGAKGANTDPPNSAAPPTGNAWDSDSYEGVINGADGRIVWVYFEWKWVGGPWADLWNDVSAPDADSDGAQDNWDYIGTPPAPGAFPNASADNVWISSATDPCTMNGSFSVGNISVTTGAVLRGTDGVVPRTLTIYGTAFKSSGGTFDPINGAPLANRNTVAFSGASSQTVIIIGGSGAFWNLTVSKTGGTTAALGTHLAVDNDILVSGGTMDLANYTLTAKGGVTVGNGAQMTVAGTSRLYVDNGATAKTVTVSGTLQVSSTGILDLGDGDGAPGATLSVSGGAGARRLRLLEDGQIRCWDSAEAIVFESGGTFESSGNAAVTRQPGGAGGYSFNMNSGSTLEVSELDFSYAGPNGFTVNSGANIGTFTNVSFTNVIGASPRRHLALGVGSNIILTGMSFDFTFDLAGGYNVVALPGSAPNTYTLSGWTQTGLSDPDSRDYDLTPEDVTSAEVIWNASLTWVGQWRRYRTVSGLGAATGNQYVFVRLDAADGLPWTGLDVANELRVACQSTSAPTASWVELARSLPTFTPASSVEVHFKLPADFSGAGGGQVRLYYDYGGGSVPAAPLSSDPESPKSILADTFETDQSWVVGAAPASGQWERGAPTGENGFAPGVDSVDTGTFAFVTGLTSTLDGTATLTSPTLSTAGYYHVAATFRRWVFFGGGGDFGSLTAAANGVTFSTVIEDYPNNTDVRAWTQVTWNAPTSFENVATPKVRFSGTEAAAGTYCEAGLDDFLWSAYKGDVLSTAVGVEVDTTVSDAGVKGEWADPFHWSNGSSPAQLGPPGTTTDVILNGNGTFAPQLVGAASIASLTIGETTSSNLNLGGASNYNLTTSGSLIWGASGTIDATGRTGGAISVGQDLEVLGGTWTMPGAAPASPFLTVGRDLTASATMTWTGSTAVDVEVVRNVNVTGGLRFPGILRMIGTGGGSPVSTVNSISSAAFRRVEINRDAPGAGSGYTVNLGGTSYWLCEVMNIDGGVVAVPAGATIEAKDQADATFDTTNANGLEWVRYSTGGSGVANRVLQLSGGTIKAGKLGSATPGAAPPYAANNNNGRLDLQAAGGTIETGYFLFKNNTDAANTSDVILSAGTVRVSNDWEISTASGTAPSFLATGGTVIFNGTTAESVTHSPSGGTPSFYSLQVGEGTNAPTVSVAQNTTCVDLDVVEGIFAPGAGRTVTKTGASPTDIQAGGTLRLAGGTILKLVNLATLNVNASGTLSTTGTSASSRARIENNGAGTWSCSVSGTMDVSYITIANLAGTGVVVNSTATLTGWTGVRFTSGAAGGLYVDLSGATVATTLPASISLCQFDAGPATNVKGAGGAATHTNVTFSSWAGALGGEQFETNDNLDLIDWGSGAAVVLRTNNPLDADVATYATLQDAILDATVANNVIEVRDNVIRDESINLSALGFRVILDGVVLRPPGGSSAIIGSGDPTKEVLRNLVLIRDAASATPLLQDVANVMHCDVLGAFTTANPLITVGAGKTCLIENSIVGDPATWQADADDPMTNSGGTLTVNYSFVDRSVVYPGTNNANANPQFQNWDPITGGSGLYDIHLKPGSTCVDYAAAPSIAVATDFDRGLDFNTPDQDPGGGNPRRPIDARPDDTDGGGPYASWNNNFAPANTYDVGADELGPLVTGTGNKPQGVPLWTNRAGAGIVADPDSFSTPIASFTFSPAVMFVAENMNVNQAGHDIRLVAYDMNDADSDGDLDILTTLDLDAQGVQKVHHVTVIGAGTQDNLYVAVDLDSDADTTADAILGLQYTPSPPTLVLRAGWAPNPAVLSGSGSIGRIVIDQSAGNTLLYFVRSDGQLYRRDTATGLAPGASVNWLGTGQLNLAGYLGKFDVEGGLFAGKFNNSIYAPTNQHANEVVRIESPTGNLGAFKDCGTGDRNHFGFNVISQSVFVTGTDQYVWRIHEDTLAFNAWPASVWPWESEPMGASVKTTTRAQMFRTVDANVRVGAGSTVYKFRRDTGVITDDSDGAGDDWGPGRRFRGNILTPPVLIGGTGKDYTPVADGRRCGKLIFGTDQGYCYVAGYIRATLASDAEDNDEPQPASSAIVGYDVLDGRPYHGFPYRIPGVKIVNIALLTSSTAGKSVIVFITDNGWAYGFIEPY